MKDWFKKLWGVLTNKKTYATIEALAPIAEDVVRQIDALVPNATVEEALAAYDKFGIPVVSSLASGKKEDLKAGLQVLGTALLQKQVGPKYGVVADNILKALIAVAVTQVRNSTPKTTP